MPDPLLLAVDTSTRNASVALARRDVLLAEYSWFAGMHHTEQLLPVIDYLLGQTGLALADLTALVVSSGPGSFNGLRVGMATVKSFAASLGLPIVAATALEVEAYAHAADPRPLCAIHDAGRKELAWAVFQGPADTWRELTEPHITTPADLVAALHAPTLLCGEIPDWCLPELHAGLEGRAVIASPAARVRHAGTLAELGWRRLDEGRVEDLHALQPLYLRRAPGTG